MLQSTSNSPMGFNTVKIEPALAGICMACASSDIAGECIEKSPCRHYGRNRQHRDVQRAPAAPWLSTKAMTSGPATAPALKSTSAMPA